jgi:hypothetical protein
MHRNQEKISAGGITTLFFLLLNTIVLERGFVFDPGWYKLSYLTLPLLLISIVRFHKRPL